MPNNEEKPTGGDQSPGDAPHQPQTRSQERYALTEKNKSDIREMLNQESISSLHDRAAELVPENLPEFVSLVQGLDHMGDDTRVVKAILFVHAERKGLYLLFGFPSIKDFAVKGCGQSASTFYRHFNAAKSGLLVREKHDKLPLVVLETLCKVAPNDPDRQTTMLAILDKAATMNRGITEANVLEVIKELAPKSTVGGDTAKVKSMKAIIKAKETVVKALGEPNSFDEKTKAKVAAFETATQDLLQLCK